MALALATAKDDTLPSMLARRTVIAKGIARLQGQRGGHSAKLFAADAAKAPEDLGWACSPFALPPELLSAWRAAGTRGRASREAWAARVSALPANDRAEFERVLAGVRPEGWREVLMDCKRRALVAEPLPSGIFISAEINDALADLMAERMVALMELPVKFVFSHDSIGIGRNGPTHQPVGILASLRAMPNMPVLRPADAVEATECWEIAFEQRSTVPSMLVFVRQALPHVRRMHTSANLSRRGAYVLAEAEGGERQVTLLATGSEVALAVQVRQALQDAGTPTAVVSMPSWELFELQEAAYRASVLGAVGGVRMACEAALRVGWDRWLGERGGFVAMRGFGASGPAETLYRHFGITPRPSSPRRAVCWPTDSPPTHTSERHNAAHRLPRSIDVRAVDPAALDQADTTAPKVVDWLTGAGVSISHRQPISAQALALLPALRLVSDTRQGLVPDISDFTDFGALGHRRWPDAAQIGIWCKARQTLFPLNHSTGDCRIQCTTPPG